MLAPTVLWFVTLKQVIQRSHQQQRQHKSFGSFHFFHFLCSKLVYILSWVWFCLRIISATFLKCETNCSQSDLHTQRDRHTHTYIQEVGLIYSTCFQCPSCDIYRNMGTCVIGNPDCGFEVDSWLSAVQCLQIIWWAPATICLCRMLSSHCFVLETTHYPLVSSYTRNSWIKTPALK